jgi:hypothetical protein
MMRTTVLVQKKFKSTARSMLQASTTAQNYQNEPSPGNLLGCTGKISPTYSTAH